ncbi:MAG: GIY-YIG nuclease family protein [Cellulosilyticaceae bacterium]
MGSISCGFLYVLSNPSFAQGIYKIGYTERTVKERIEELRSTGVPTPFKEVCSLYVPYVQDAEKIIHEILAENRIENDREFFKCTMEEINYAISTLDVLYYRLLKEVGGSLNAIMDLGIKVDDECILQRLDSTFFYCEYDIKNVLERKNFYIKEDKVYISVGGHCLGTYKRLEEYLQQLQNHNDKNL